MSLQSSSQVRRPASGGPFSAQDLQQLLGDLPGMAYRCHNVPSLAMEYASGGCYALSGYTAELLTSGNPNWGDLIHTDDKNLVWKNLQGALRRDTPFDVQYRLRTQAGRHRWIWDRGKAVAVEGGETVLEGFATDITALRLELSAAKHSDVAIEHSPIGIAMLNKEHRILSVNTAFARMLGYPPDDLIGRRIAELVYDDEDRSAATVDDTSTGEGGNGCAAHRRYRHKEGHAIHASVTTGIVHDDNGKPEYVVANVEDLTPRLAAEVHLEEQHQQLACLERLSGLSEMMSGIAHEINQPLAAISTYAQSGLRFLNADTPKPERLSEALTKLSDEVRRTAAVVERIRELARQRVSRNERLNCNDTLAQVKELMMADARAKGVRIRIESEPTIAPVWADGIQIQQVLVNLLRNGIDSMASAKLAFGDEIVMRASMKDEATVQVEVIDQGQGISEAVAKDLFRHFSIFEKNGLGLGLAISRSILAAFGGQLDFANNRQAGATFFITLPAMDGGIDCE